jgi:hypothetical protein
MDRKPLSPRSIDPMDSPGNSEPASIVDVEAQLRTLLTLGGSGEGSKATQQRDDYFAAGPGYGQRRASVGSSDYFQSLLLIRMILRLQINKHPNTNHSGLQALCRFNPSASPALLKYRVGMSSSKQSLQSG